MGRYTAACFILKRSILGPLTNTYFVSYAYNNTTNIAGEIPEEVISKLEKEVKILSQWIIENQMKAYMYKANKNPNWQ